MATTPLFNLDLTGTNVNNRVIGEPHSLPVRRYRSIAPLYGPYYTESLIVTDASNSELLTKDIHYKCVDIVGIPTAQTGKEICTVLVITAPTVSSQVTITYQALGGGYEHNHEAIKKLIDNLLVDDRPVYWPSIINRPADFTPSHHLHAIGDVYGFEYLTSELERLRTSIMLGDERSHTDILNYIDSNINTIKSVVESAESSALIQAIAKANDAAVSSQTAISDVTTLDQNVSSALLELSNTVALYNTLADNQVTAEAQAIALINTYS